MTFSLTTTDNANYLTMLIQDNLIGTNEQNIDNSKTYSIQFRYPFASILHCAAFNAGRDYPSYNIGEIPNTLNLVCQYYQNQSGSTRTITGKFVINGIYTVHLIGCKTNIT